MSFEELMKTVAEAVKENPGLYGTPVIVLDPGDVANGIETLFAKASRCVVVMFGGSAPVKQGLSGPLIDKVRIVVRVFDKPSLTRVDRPGVTLLGMAREIAKGLQHLRREGMTSALYYRGIGEITQYKGGIVSCDVNFDTDECL